jgi:hypothetical protein
MRNLRSRVWALAAVATLAFTGSLALTTATPAGADGSGISVHCPTDDLQAALNSAAPGSTVVVDGTCTGNFDVWKSLTLVGPATLDGANAGPTLHVSGGLVVVNNLTIQHGSGFGGGLWNETALTLNNATVTDNNGGGIVNTGQLTVNSSMVSHNTSDWNGGGIYNCGANPSINQYGLCLVPATLTLNGSTISNNVNTFGSGGGILNDPLATLTVNSSTVAGNTAGTSGGGIENNGAATISRSTIATNVSNGGVNTWSGGGGIHNTGPTTLNNSLVQGNTAAVLAGGIFASGQLTINKGTVTGNTAGPAGGGMVAWDGPTTVANSTFSNNTDQNSGNADNPAGVWVAPANFYGFFTNNPTFTVTHSTFS